MRIIHISPSYKPAVIYGGPIVSVSRLCEELTAAKHNCEVITTKANGKRELLISSKTTVAIDGVRVQYFNRITKDPTHFSPALLWNLYQKTNKKEKIILHIHSWWNCVATLSCLIAKFNNVPVVLSPRGMLTNYTFKNRNNILKSLIHHTIGKRLIAYCHIHATSEMEKQDILKIQIPKSITVIPNFGSFTANRVYTKNSYINIPFKLLFISRIEEKKGLDLLLKSLSNCNFLWKLTIAGTGKQSYIHTLKELAEQLNISDHIEWMGQINEQKKQEVFISHHLLVLFSHNENFANIVLESLSAALPVAISKHVGLADYVLKNDLGWVSELNTTSITQILNTAYLDIEKRIRINNTAPALIRSHFSTSNLLFQYLKLYKRSNEKS